MKLRNKISIEENNFREFIIKVDFLIEFKTKKLAEENINKIRELLHEVYYSVRFYLSPHC